MLCFDTKNKKLRISIACAILLTVFYGSPSFAAVATKKFDGFLETTAANFLAARQALYFKDFKSSAKFYLTVLKSDQNNTNFLQQAFYTQYQLGDINAAAALARKMEALNVTNGFASEPATAQAILMEDWDAVLVLSDLIAENIEARPIAAVIKAWALAATGQGGSGLSHLIKNGKANLSVDQSIPAVFLIQAALLAEYLNDNNEMLKLADQLFVRDDLTSQITLQLASLFARNNESKKFEYLLARLPDGFNKKSLRKSLSEKSPQTKIRNHIAAGIIDASLINRESRNRKMLRSRLGLALFLDPKLDSAHFLLAQKLNEIGRKKEASDQLLSIDPYGIWSQPRLLFLSDIKRDGDISHAIELLEESIYQDNQNAILQKELGDLYRISKQHDKARDSYLKAAQLGLISADLDRNLGMSYEQLEQDKLAEISFKAALKKNPKDPFTLNYLGYWWADDGRNLEEAIQLIEQAVRLRPRSGYFVDSLGWVHFKLRNFDLAVSFLEQATILEPMDPVIAAHLGDAYWETGRYHEARFKWQYALSIAKEEKLILEITSKLAQ